MGRGGGGRGGGDGGGEGTECGGGERRDEGEGEGEEEGEEVMVVEEVKVWNVMKVKGEGEEEGEEEEGVVVKEVKARNVKEGKEEMKGKGVNGESFPSSDITDEVLIDECMKVEKKEGKGKNDKMNVKTFPLMGISDTTLLQECMKVEDINYYYSQSAQTFLPNSFDSCNLPQSFYASGSRVDASSSHPEKRKKSVSRLSLNKRRRVYSESSESDF